MNWSVSVISIIAPTPCSQIWVIPLFLEGNLDHDLCCSDCTLKWNGIFLRTCLVSVGVVLNSSNPVDDDLVTFISGCIVYEYPQLSVGTQRARLEAELLSSVLCL